MAGKIFYLPPIDYASGKVYGSKCNFTSVRRSANLHPNGCAYISERNLVLHPYSELELTLQQKFRAVAAATRLRLNDPSKATQDKQDFKAQSAFRTLYQFVFNIEWNSYQQ